MPHLQTVSLKWCHLCQSRTKQTLKPLWWGCSTSLVSSARHACSAPFQDSRCFIFTNPIQSKYVALYLFLVVFLFFFCFKYVYIYINLANSTPLAEIICTFPPFYSQTWKLLWSVRVCVLPAGLCVIVSVRDFTQNEKKICFPKPRDYRFPLSAQRCV